MAIAKTTSKGSAPKKATGTKSAPKAVKTFTEPVKKEEIIEEEGAAEVIETSEETLIEGKEIGGNDVETVSEEGQDSIEGEPNDEESEESAGQEVGSVAEDETETDKHSDESDEEKNDDKDDKDGDEVVGDIKDIVASIETPEEPKAEVPVAKKKPVRRNYYNDRFGNAWNGMINTY